MTKIFLALAGLLISAGIALSQTPQEYISRNQGTQTYTVHQGIGGDYLFNEQLGNQGSSGIKIQYMRFRAATSAALNSFTMYYQATGGAGYSGGTGGTWSAAIYADDGSPNHFPTGSALATVNIAAQGTATIEDFTASWATPAVLVKGNLYHLVLTNTDASSATNYFSPNYWYYDSTPIPTGSFNGALSPRFIHTDWGHGFFNDPGGPWQERLGFQQILGLTYADGTTQGQSYGEASLGAGQQGQISGLSDLIRENFTVTNGPWAVSAVGIRLIKIAGGTAPLTVSLQTSAGVLIDSFNIPASQVPNGLAPTTGTGLEAKWVFGLFQCPRVLNNGVTYNLQFSTAAGTTYWAWVNRDLSKDHPNYPSSTGFASAKAQVSTNGGITWSSAGAVSNVNDWQFYLVSNGTK